MTSKCGRSSLSLHPFPGDIGKAREPGPLSQVSILTVSRRDDLTVQVIFFGKGEKTGEVTVNLDATAQPDEPKAKL